MLRRSLLLAGCCALALALTATAGSADLTSRYQAGRQRAQQLRSQISAQTQRIRGFQGTLASLQSRLQAVQRSVATEQALLTQVTQQLTAARARLVQLRAAYVRDLAALGAQLRAQYESAPPNLLNVVVDARGFDQLVNGIRDLTAIEHANVATTRAVRAARTAVQAQTVVLARVQARRRRATAAVVVERDQIVALRLSIAEREAAAERARSGAQARLARLRRTLIREARILDAEAARAQTLASGGAVAPPGGCASAPFVPHGGEWGFFPAPGTNYAVNQEPIIAARLDQLGRALQLHLIGLSGYRSPQHSVEVGGFADDPHTRGEASDTPGVEGVPEATLEQFCLTRPFPGPREADHIQEGG